MSMFQQAKIYLVETTGLARDALHIYVALGLFVACCLLFGWKAREWRPWLVVLLAAIAGEVLDIRDTMAKSAPLQLGESWKDLWNTMVLPTVLMLAARYTGIFAKPDAAPEMPESGDEAQMPATPLGSERDVL